MNLESMAKQRGGSRTRLWEFLTYILMTMAKRKKNRKRKHTTVCRQSIELFIIGGRPFMALHHYHHHIVDDIKKEKYLIEEDFN